MAHGSICSCNWKKHFEMSKIQNKILTRTSHLSAFYVSTTSFVKKHTSFVACIKKEKQISLNVLFSTKKFLFTNDTKMPIFRWTTLWAHKMSRCTCATCFLNFWHLKNHLKHIYKIPRVYAPLLLFFVTFWDGDEHSNLLAWYFCFEIFYITKKIEKRISMHQEHYCSGAQNLHSKSVAIIFWYVIWHVQNTPFA